MEFESRDIDEMAWEQFIIKIIDWAQRNNKSVYQLSKNDVKEAMSNK